MCLPLAGQLCALATTSFQVLHPLAISGSPSRWPQTHTGHERAFNQRTGAERAHSGHRAGTEQAQSRHSAGTARAQSRAATQQTAARGCKPHAHNVQFVLRLWVATFTKGSLAVCSHQCGHALQRAQQPSLVVRTLDTRAGRYKTGTGGMPEERTDERDEHMKSRKRTRPEPDSDNTARGSAYGS